MSKELENKIVGTDLCKLATLLYDYSICGNTSPLNNAGQSCISTATDKLWRYTLEKLVFNVDPVGGRIPSDSEDITVSLSIKIEGVKLESEQIENPLNNLFFDMEIEGSRSNEHSQDIDSLYACWHLDKHINTSADGKTKYLHPLYHLAFGGSKMEARGNVFGNSLILPSPRFCYPPMDAVLGINFIIRNYLHKDKIEKITADPEYYQILKRSQERLWRPFFSSLYSYWNIGEFVVTPDFVPEKLFPLYC